MGPFINSPFDETLNDWELDIVQNFFWLINNRSVNRTEKDRLLWKGGKNGLFTVKENYELMVGGNTKTVPMKMPRNNCVPPEVCFCLGSLVGKSTNIGLTLKRGFQMESRFPLCGKAEEVPDHLLIHCPSI